MSNPPSASILEKSLGRFRGQLTVADAAARSGLPLHEAEEGLRHLTAEFSGHLAASDKGELLYSFPRGLERPPETRRSRRALKALKRGVLGVLRFTVRAWVSVVMIGYALAFAAVLLAMALRRDDDRDGGGLDLLHVVLRVIAEAVFWTFHPFSPMYLAGEPGWMHTRRRRAPRIPFYERVNRFVFGPQPPAVDPMERQRVILAEIRRLKGRVAPADIQRVTGVDRDEAERILLRLVMDQRGEITVTDDGAILYRFAELRTTADAQRRPFERGAEPIWTERVPVPPLTGNSAGTNLLLTVINAFNLIASSVALAGGWTLERLVALFARAGAHDPTAMLPPLPPVDGIPLVMGAIPFAFSLALFVLPILRLLRRPATERRVARENGRRGLLRVALGDVPGALRASYSPDELRRAWQAATGRAPTDDELRDAARDLGGEIELRDDGTLEYRFDALAREVDALGTARAAAGQDEAFAGEVVFSSADAGTGIREDAGATAGRPATAAATPAATRARPGAAASDGGEGEGARGDGPTGPRMLPERPERLEEPMDFIERALAEAQRRRK